jgi:hypothetical protein
MHASYYLRFYLRACENENTPLGTERIADHIVVLNKGEIEAQGNFAEVFISNNRFNVWSNCRKFD